MRFEELLCLATGISFVVWGYDYCFARLRRKVTGAHRHGLITFTIELAPIFLLVLILRSFIAEPFRIPSSSMEPSLLIGDFLVVNKYRYGLRLPILGTKLTKGNKVNYGDILLFRYDAHQDFIKRVVGLPGDTVSYRDKNIFINGKRVEIVKNFGLQPWNDTMVFQKREKLGKVEHDLYLDVNRNARVYQYSTTVVPAGHYFVMGDNRDHSEDSRVWGFVEDKKIIGRAAFLWFSIDIKDWRHINVRWHRIGKNLTK